MFKASFRSGLETVMERFEIIGQGEVQGHRLRETTMKKRRIEITAFRRRTTLVIHDKSDGLAVKPPAPHAEVSRAVDADSLQPEEAELNQSPEIQPAPASLALTRFGK